MMRADKGDGWARGVGLLLGLSLALIAVLSWRIPQGTGALGTDLVIASNPTGELEISPAGPLISVAGLEPGDEADAPVGTLHMRNQTGSTLYVRIRGLPSGSDLDQLLWVRIEDGGRALFRGPVGDLRYWTERGITLVPGERATISVRAWLPNSVIAGYEGRIQTVDLEFQSISAGAG